ncbi:MAG TPA: GNAT family N-acetyltransferase, partial [Candidatus Limnocylindrales bacterium]|nr:GNAT family N-acetyltransferase [Candidatus Limnocylindrales bacterium]
MNALPVTEEPMVRRAAPPDVSLRPFAGEADLQAFVNIFRAANQVDRIDERTSLEALRNWAGHPSPSFQAERDIVVAVVDGEPVAYGWTLWVDASDGIRDYATGGHVHPDWRQRGVGSAILQHNEAHIREVAAGHETGRPRSYTAFAPERRPGAVALLKGNGYGPVRYFFDMLRPTLDAIRVTELPQGIEIRPVAGRKQLRQLFDADVEAFRDHWGGFDASDASFEGWFTDPDYDPALFLVAWDGDEIAGAVTNVIVQHENEELGRRRGLLDSVFVRRPWRGRGLAAALVGRSLQLLRDQGMDSAWLGVDADNPNGALRLYENAGFVVDVR